MGRGLRGPKSGRLLRDPSSKVRRRLRSRTARPVFVASRRKAVQPRAASGRRTRASGPDCLCLAPSVGLSQPWRFVIVDSPDRRSAIRRNFEQCNADALTAQPTERQGQYVRLKLAGLDEAPCHLAVFADHSTDQGHGLGRRTMPEVIEYSVVMAIHTLWLAARAEGIGLGWVSILDPEQVRADLEVASEWTFIGYLCLGYPEAEDDCLAGT